MTVRRGRWKGVACAAIAAAVTLTSSPGAAQQAPTDPCAAISGAGFHRDKVRLANALAAQRTVAARACFERLLDEGSSWNREAGVAGLLALEDGAVADVLIPRLLSDTMIRDDITAGFKAAPGRYLGALEQALGRTTDPDERAVLLAAVAARGSQGGQRLLRGLVSDPQSGDRVVALQILARDLPEDNDAFIRDRLSDETLRPVVLAYLLDHGTSADLAAFVTACRVDDDSLAALGYRGVAKLGDGAAREAALLGALDAGRDTRAQAALLTLTGLGGEALRARLCRTVTSASEPATRVLAAEYLSSWNDPRVVPCLIPALKEQYAPPARGVADVVASVLTGGILSVLSDTASLLGKKDFEARKRRVAERLPVLSGADVGPGYAQWLEWALCRGLTVDGTNLAQRLLAPDRETRRRAADCACAVLGAGDVTTARLREPGLPADERGLLLELARRLVDRGMLEDAP